MLVRFLANLLLNPINIPLRRFAFATRRGPPSKGESLDPGPALYQKPRSITRQDDILRSILPFSQLRASTRECTF